MWKYVSRRIKDTFEKTHNVFDVGRTGFCGSEKVYDSSGDGIANPKTSKSLTRFSRIWTSPGSQFSNTSGQDEYKEKINHENLNHTWLGAITWSSAIICGWYASQWLCFRKRTFRWDNRCPYAKSLAAHARSFHTNNVLPRTAFAAPVGGVENRLYAKYDFVPKKFIYEVNNTLPENKSPELKQSEPESVESAVKQLLYTIGEIEYQFGVQNILAGEYKTAISHLKLATSHQHAGATFNLGLCYERGLGVEKDMKMAMECYQVASSLGHPKAMYNLGVFYIRGLGGLQKSRKAAQECFIAAAKLGQREAQHALDMKNRILNNENILKDMPKIIPSRETITAI